VPAYPGCPEKEAVKRVSVANVIRRVTVTTNRMYFFVIQYKYVSVRIKEPSLILERSRPLNHVGTLPSSTLDLPHSVVVLIPWA